MKRRFIRWGRALAMGTMLCLLLSLCGFAGTCDTIRARVVRLHILANSDSEEDQAVKLRVRDALTATAAGWFDRSTTSEEAMTTIRERLDVLRAVAQRTIAEAGHDDPVTVTCARTWFDTRTYDTGQLPAGWYDAVQVVIGAGEGHNWWCVVFPPLCVSAATDAATWKTVLPDEGTDVVTRSPRYTVRFKLVEWYERICAAWQ